MDILAGRMAETVPDQLPILLVDVRLLEEIIEEVVQRRRPVAIPLAIQPDRILVSGEAVVEGPQVSIGFPFKVAPAGVCVADEWNVRGVFVVCFRTIRVFPCDEPLE